jgi:EpsI family protein
MNAVRMKAAAAFVLMAVAFGGAVAWKPTQHLADQRAKVELESLFPRAFGDWKLDERMPVQLVSPDTQALLNQLYNQTLSRTYVNARGDRIMLSVAYGGDQSDATRAHRPEVCYPAQGFQVLSNETASVATENSPGLPVRRLVTKLGARVEPVTYWIMVGERVALSGTQQKLLQLGYSVRGVVPDGMLVRVSSIDAESARAYGIQAAFIRDMERVVSVESRPRVFGVHVAGAT